MSETIMPIEKIVESGGGSGSTGWTLFKTLTDTLGYTNGYTAPPSNYNEILVVVWKNGSQEYYWSYVIPKQEITSCGTYSTGPCKMFRQGYWLTSSNFADCLFRLNSDKIGVWDIHVNGAEVTHTDVRANIYYR